MQIRGYIHTTPIIRETGIWVYFRAPAGGIQIKIREQSYGTIRIQPVTASAKDPVDSSLIGGDQKRR